MKVIEVTYNDLDWGTVKKVGVLLKETDKLLKMETKNSDLWSRTKHIKKENVISIVEYNRNEAISLVRSCSDLNHFEGKLSL